MTIKSDISDQLILIELGERLARVRLEKNLTQSELAQQAGVGLRTVQRLETGAVATRLSSFLLICRVLGLAQQFELLVPEPVGTAIDRPTEPGSSRRRASRQPSRESETWAWGEA